MHHFSLLCQQIEIRNFVERHTQVFAKADRNKTEAQQLLKRNAEGTVGSISVSCKYRWRAIASKEFSDYILLNKMMHFAGVIQR
jgi:hypothetical protein